MKKEFNDLLTPPDFERRCDRFAVEVKNEVVGDYPELGIYPVNRTREDLVHINPKAIELAKEHGSGQKVINNLRRFDKIQEELSAFESVGAVEVWGWEGPNAVPQIKEASARIDVIAIRHGGIKEMFGDEEESLNDPVLPCAYLVYTFK